MICVTCNGGIKNLEMRKLLDVDNNGYALNFMERNGETHQLIENKYRRWCTYGPTTWYQRIGINLVWWNPYEYTNSTYEKTSKNMTNNHFKLVWHGTLEEANACSKDAVLNSNSCGNVAILPGDIATFHVYKKKGGTDPSSHGVMWTGLDWRSDCIQTNHGMSCYRNGESRQGEYSVCLWRLPKLQEKDVEVKECNQ